MSLNLYLRYLLHLLIKFGGENNVRDIPYQRSFEPPSKFFRNCASVLHTRLSNSETIGRERHEDP